MSAADTLASERLERAKARRELIKARRAMTATNITRMSVTEEQLAAATRVVATLKLWGISQPIFVSINAEHPSATVKIRARDAAIFPNPDVFRPQPDGTVLSGLQIDGCLVHWSFTPGRAAARADA